VISSNFISDIKFQKPNFVSDSFIYSTTSSSLVKFNKDLSINTVLNFQTRDFQKDIPNSQFQYKVLKLFKKSGKLQLLYSNNRILDYDSNNYLELNYPNTSISTLTKSASNQGDFYLVTSNSELISLSILSASDRSFNVVQELKSSGATHPEFLKVVVANNKFNIIYRHENSLYLAVICNHGGNAGNGKKEHYFRLASLTDVKLDCFHENPLNFVDATHVLKDNLLVLLFSNNNLCAVELHLVYQSIFNAWQSCIQSHGNSRLPYPLAKHG